MVKISKILEKVRGVKIEMTMNYDGFARTAYIQTDSSLCNRNLKELNLPKGIELALY